MSAYLRIDSSAESDDKKDDLSVSTLMIGSTCSRSVSVIEVQQKKYLPARVRCTRRRRRGSAPNSRIYRNLRRNRESIARTGT